MPRKAKTFATTVLGCLLWSASFGPAEAQEYAISTIVGETPKPPPTPVRGVDLMVRYPLRVATDFRGNAHFSGQTNAFGQTSTANGFVAPVNIQGTAAKLPSVKGVAVDAAGNVFFVSGGSSGAFDAGYSVLRLDAATGILTSVAGNGTPGYSGDNGPATSAQLGGATSVAVDRAGNIYIADTNNGVVRKVSNGVIATVANVADLEAITVDSAGSLYIFANGSVGKVANGVITLLVGGAFYPDGFGTSNAAAVDSAGNLYYADSENCRILKISNGTVTTVAGRGRIGFSGDNGPAISADLMYPRGVAVDAAGNLYIADTGNQRIRKVSNGVITTVAGGGAAANGLGDNGPATSAGLNYPFGVAVDSSGNLYIEDTVDNRVRRVSNGVMTTVAGGGSTPVLLARSAGIFTTTGSMNTARIGHAATLLGNGKVLIAGGYSVSITGTSAIASSELYDPGAGTFAPTGSMNPALGFIIATLLPDGRVLLVGTTNPFYNDSVAIAELYDPATGTFASAGSLLKISRPVTATLLNNGRVLVTGGSDQDPFAYSGYTAELYDPSTGVFAATGNMARSHYIPAAVLLPSGKVLITAGSCNSNDDGSELYDPATGTFSRGGETPCTNGAPATLLTNGKVLIEGGLYDPSTGTFTDGRGILQVDQRTILLPDETVLITGGEPCVATEDGCSFSSVADSYLYDQSREAFGWAGIMTRPRRGHQTTLLPDGTVLVSGGQGECFQIPCSSLASAEIYTPPTLVPAPVLFSLSGDGRGQGAIWHAATGQITSPQNPAVPGEALSMYTTSLVQNGSIPPQVSIGGRLSEILFFGNAPGYPGYNQVNVRVPGGIAPGPAVSLRLTYLGRPSNEVTIGVQ
jgi:sugar lactone lactonase YvrE